MIDRLLGPIRAIVNSILEEKLFGLYEFAVDSFDEAAQTVSASPIKRSSRLHPVAGVPIRTPLLKLKLLPGDTVVIGFEGGEPSSPFVACFGNASANGTAQPVVRLGDFAALGGKGFQLLLTPLPGNSSPAVVPGVPYLVSFGSLTNPPTPLVQSAGYAPVISASLAVKSR